tara:strand:- start:2053 stop:2739 length:687 start_codon:yes stop_codon:yes gene_type:complete
MKLLRTDLFDLNPQRKIHSKRIGEGQHHLVVIDDLFQNPREISSLMDELPYTDHPNVRRSAPTYRCMMNFPSQHDIYREVFKLQYEAYPEINQLSEERCSFDRYFDGAPIVNGKNCPPHVDSPKNCAPYYALVIYMNERNLHGGTQFLRHATLGSETSTGTDEVFDYAPTTIRLATPWDFLPSEWCLYYLAPMRFNRLISYRNNLLHSLYTNGSFYRDTPRKTIVSNF